MEHYDRSFVGQYGIYIQRLCAKVLPCLVDRGWKRWEVKYWGGSSFFWELDSTIAGVNGGVNRLRKQTLRTNESGVSIARSYSSWPGNGWESSIAFEAGGARLAYRQERGGTEEVAVRWQYDEAALMNLAIGSGGLTAIVRRAFLSRYEAETDRQRFKEIPVDMMAEDDPRVADLLLGRAIEVEALEGVSAPGCRLTVTSAKGSTPFESRNAFRPRFEPYRQSDPLRRWSDEHSSTEAYAVAELLDQLGLFFPDWAELVLEPRRHHSAPCFPRAGYVLVIRQERGEPHFYGAPPDEWRDMRIARGGCVTILLQADLPLLSTSLAS